MVNSIGQVVIVVSQHKHTYFSCDVQDIDRLSKLSIFVYLSSVARNVITIDSKLAVHQPGGIRSAPWKLFTTDKTENGLFIYQCNVNLFYFSIEIISVSCAFAIFHLESLCFTFNAIYKLDGNVGDVWMKLHLLLFLLVCFASTSL